MSKDVDEQELAAAYRDASRSGDLTEWRRFSGSMERGDDADD